MAEEERLYDYTNQRETGEEHNLYWNNFSKKLTKDQLREQFNAKDNGQLRAAFGDFDNYLAYMDERQNFIDVGLLKADWWDTGVALIDPESVDRVDYHEINLLDNSMEIPAGADVYWMSQFLDCFSEQEIEAILLKIKKTAICGTDLHILKGDVATCNPGRILGHEGVGIVDTVGAAVTAFKVGDKRLVKKIF